MSGSAPRGRHTRSRRFQRARRRRGHGGSAGIAGPPAPTSAAWRSGHRCAGRCIRRSRRGPDGPAGSRRPRAGPAPRGCRGRRSSAGPMPDSCSRRGEPMAPEDRITSAVARIGAFGGSTPTARPFSVTMRRTCTPVHRQVRAPRAGFQKAGGGRGPAIPCAGSAGNSRRRPEPRRSSRGCAGCPSRRRAEIGLADRQGRAGWLTPRGPPLPCQRLS
jgi:hypothetical protein